eukprot:TRINITY_DN11390_c0_g2_i6.p1 TRINITY_DN11390_c0_g2~~TRINITY_DN11390_c0_g2_i6.p1  ORF type:complete len:480 (+),score=142.94 TRINITY_DN11390_c0_g2_i6:46-1440(+)
MLRSLVGSEMCIRDSINAEYGAFLSADNGGSMKPWLLIFAAVAVTAARATPDEWVEKGSDVDHVLKSNQVMSGTKMKPVSPFSGLTSRDMGASDAELDKLTKLVLDPNGTNTQLATLFRKIEKVCADTLQTMVTGNSALERFDGLGAHPLASSTTGKDNLLLAQAGWGEAMDHNYAKMAKQASRKFKQHYDQQVQAIVSACQQRVKQAEAGLDFVQVQDESDPVTAWQEFVERETTQLYPRLVALSIDAGKFWEIAANYTAELAELKAGDRQEAKELQVAPTGYARDVKKNRGAGLAISEAKRRMYQLVSEWLDLVSDKQARLKGNCIARIKVLQEDLGLPSGVEALLSWPLGIQSGKMQDQPPVSITQTKDYAETLAESPTAVIQNLLVEYQADRQLTQAQLLQTGAEWGNQDSGNTKVMEQALRKLLDDWREKFQRVKTVYDEKCARNVASARALYESKNPS